MNLPIILASASPARLKLLKQINIIPDQVIAADIDERSKRGELPQKMAERLAKAKATKVAEGIRQGIIIGADTVPVVGRSIMRKAANAEEVRKSLILLSQRRHRVYTSVCIIKKDTEIIRICQKNRQNYH